MSGLKKFLLKQTLTSKFSFYKFKKLDSRVLKISLFFAGNFIHFSFIIN
ncbi:Uncharacterized protein dnl_33350 [Desulfonema limicola]|uniref:Uncharacterized protein n=1 Tax=Desulfonema limicola TaxID=45656 RepID=A0A975GH82_9BACT|nr:Uncharacterized protein dnl_33350 [Desulfonema limicola]